MCGRYVSKTDADGIARLFVVDQRHVDALIPSYNVAPTDEVPAVVEHADQRHLVTFRWGLVPHWAKDRKNAARMINARSETAADKPAFRDALARRRCIIPADGFYEWERRDGRRLPWFFHRDDRRLLGFAGLWATWRGPDSTDAPVLRTCTILTTTAEQPMSRLHHRMPVMLEPENWQRWLDRSVDAPGVEDLLRPSQPKGLSAYRVAAEVNAVTNNGPHLLDPVTA